MHSFAISICIKLLQTWTNKKTARFRQGNEKQISVWLDGMWIMKRPRSDGRVVPTRGRESSETLPRWSRRDVPRRPPVRCWNTYLRQNESFGCSSKDRADESSVRKHARYAARPFAISELVDGILLIPYLRRNSGDSHAEASRRHRLYPAERYLTSCAIVSLRKAIIPRCVESTPLTSSRRRMRGSPQPRDLSATATISEVAISSPRVPRYFCHFEPFR